MREHAGLDSLDVMIVVGFQKGSVFAGCEESSHARNLLLHTLIVNQFNIRFQPVAVTSQRPTTRGEASERKQVAQSHSRKSDP